MMKASHLIVAVLFASFALQAGCVERTISITTEPSGALVYLNDREVGRTPVTVPFTWYGKYDVRIEAEGHRALWTTAEAKMPLWELPGPDLIAEAIPDAKSEIKWHFQLEPATEADPDQLVERAQQLRNNLLDNTSPQND